MNTKPNRYRADCAGLSRDTIIRLAQLCEGRSEWRQAAAFWHEAGELARPHEVACLSIATSGEMGDAWRADAEQREFVNARPMPYRAFCFRWLLANDCLHEAGLPGARRLLPPSQLNRGIIWQPGPQPPGGWRRRWRGRGGSWTRERG